MQILQDEGKCRLAAIRSAALADHTGRGVEKERAIIGLPVVVAGHAESQRAAQNQQRGRKQPPMVMGVDQRRIKRGEVWPPFVETALKDRKSTRLNSSHTVISYAVFCLKKKNRS